MAKYPYKIDGGDLTAQEEYVLDQVKAGELADLKEQFGEAEENRRLRARFLEELLTGGLEGFKVHQRGIFIAHGLVAEALDLANAEIAPIVSLDNCLFQEEAIFRDARFQRHLDLNNSRFQKKADFHRVEVKLGLLCLGAIFQGGVNFSYTVIFGQFNADGAQFQGQGPDNKANFNAMKLGQHAFFDNAVFLGPVNFGSADIGGQFNADGVQFHGQGPDNEVIFNAMKVGQSAFFRNSKFRGPVNFVNANIGRLFIANGAHFQGQGADNEANFNGMKVGQNASFCGAKFNGPTDFSVIKVGEHFDIRPLKMSSKDKPQPTIFEYLADFGGADIGRQFSAKEAKFLGQGPENMAIFSAMKVGQDASLFNAFFHGSVDFGWADIGRVFIAIGGQFQGQGPENKANFHAMKVGQSAFFDNAIFQGPVDFANANIGGQFNATLAKFENEDGTSFFNGMNVGDFAFFDGAVFKGGLTLDDARLLDLKLRDLKAPVAELSLERTVVGRDLSIKNATLGKLKAINLEVKVNAALEQVTIQEEADLRDSSFQALHLHEVTWPANKDEVWLEGLTYKAIYAGDEPKAWEKLLAWVEGSRFNTQNYSELEAYYARCGHRGRADKIYIAGKSREKRKSLKDLKEMPWWHPGRWLLWLNLLLTRFFWGLLAAYGRKPGRIFWVALTVFLLGAVIYDPAQMLSAKVQENIGLAPDNFFLMLTLRAILSLYGFLSAIPGWGAHLNLIHPDFLTFGFSWFQRLCGWILIPIGLAAVYTRLK
jgi:hypothetical protein